MIISANPLELFGFSVITAFSEYKSIIELDKQLSIFKSETKSDIEWNFYVPFGDLDLLVGVSGHTHDRQLILKLENIKHSNSLRAFRIESAGLKSTFASPLYVLLFIKLNEELLASKGLYFSLAQAMSNMQNLLDKHINHIAYDLFVTLGWYELVMLVNFNSFPKLSSFLMECRNIETKPSLSHLLQDRMPIIRSTFSIPMIKCNKIQDRLKETSAFPDVEISGSLRLSCRPGRNIANIISSVGKELNSDNQMLIGPDDMVFRFQQVKIKDLFENIINIRSKLNTDIYYTKTTIALPLEQGI